MKGKVAKIRYVDLDTKNADKCIANKIFTTAARIDLPLEERPVMAQLRTRIFHVGIDAPIMYHNISALPVSCISDFSENFSRIVIINPFSPSCHISREALQYFEKLVALLQSRGYIVYTNATGDRLPLKNTRHLNCSLQEMLGICSKIPFIVSVRSGLLDFLVKTNIDMFVVFSEGGVIRKDVYSLKDWGGLGFIEEVTYDDVSRDNDLLLFEKFLKERGQKTQRHAQ